MTGDAAADDARPGADPNGAGSVVVRWQWILAINTATDALGVAVVRCQLPLVGPPELETRSEVILGPSPQGSGHSERLMPTVAWAAEAAGTGPAELGGVAVVAGPGGFTGVRTGLAAAKAIAQSLGIPVQGVDTLEALAAGYAGEGLLSPLLDARRGEVFAALYRSEAGRLERLASPVLLPLPEWLARLAGEQVRFLGEGARRYSEMLAPFPGALPVPPEAHAIRPGVVARLAAPSLAAGGEDPHTLVPRYHRAPAMAPSWQAGVGTRTW